MQKQEIVDLDHSRCSNQHTYSFYNFDFNFKKKNDFFFTILIKITKIEIFSKENNYKFAKTIKTKSFASTFLMKSMDFEHSEQMHTI